MRRWRTRGGRLRVLARRWRPDSNPLRRTADRVEAAVMILLIATFLTGAPLAALTAGQAAAASGLRAQHAQAGWHRVTAVLLRKAPSSVNPMFEVALQPLVPARWTAPDGTSRTGEVHAPANAVAGSTVPVWIDRSGRRAACWTSRRARARRSPDEARARAGRRHLLRYFAAAHRMR